MTAHQAETRSVLVEIGRKSVEIEIHTLMFFGLHVPSSLHILKSSNSSYMTELNSLFTCLAVFCWLKKGLLSLEFGPLSNMFSGDIPSDQLLVAIVRLCNSGDPDWVFWPPLIQEKLQREQLRRSTLLKNLKG